MDAIGKFDADVRKILKHTGPGPAAEEQIARCFLEAAPPLAAVPDSIAALWRDRHRGNVDWLAEALAFLRETELAEPTPDGRGISDEDWEDIKDAVTADAEELPLETLTTMMQRFVSKGLV